jgi:membrane protease YdiL (CAAX protease family)
MTDQLILLVELMGVVAITMLLGMSPRFQRRPLAFQFPRREAIISFSLALVVGVGLWIIYARLPITLPSIPKTFQFSLDQLLRQVMVAVVIALPFAAAIIIRGQPWRSAGVGKQTLRPSLQLGLALGVITIFLRGKLYSILGGLSLSEIYFLVAMLAIGFAEEFAFRGYIQPRLAGWMGERWGWIVTALIFTLCHIPGQILVAGLTTPAALGLSLLDLFVFGLVQGWIMRKSGNITASGLYYAIHLWVMYL